MTLSTTQRIRKLLRRHNLDHIELKSFGGLVIARAFPAMFHPIIRRRREDAIADLEAAGETSISLAEAEQIARKSASDPVAQAKGNCIDTALDALEKLLAA